MIHSQVAKLLWLTLLLSGAALLTAQDDPFGAKPEAAAGTKANSKGKASAKDDEIPRVLQRQREHPVVQSLRENPPRTLAEHTRALKLLLEVNRPDEFRELASKWLALKPTPADLLAFHEQYGGSVFWEMTRREAFQPEGNQIGSLVLTAAADDAHDPALLTAAVQQLFQDSTRSTGLKRLVRGGSAGAVAILQLAATDADPVHHEQLQRALLSFRSEAVGPCLATLYSGNDPARATAALVLGKLNATAAIPHLVGMTVGPADQPVTAAAAQAVAFMTNRPPSREEVRTFLLRQIEHLLSGELPAATDADGRIPLWQWNAASKSPVLRRFESHVAPIVVAEQLATYLPALDDTSRTLLPLTLRVRLEAAKLVVGLDLPLEPSLLAETLKLPRETLSTVLTEAQQHGQWGAAAACCEILAASPASTPRGSNEVAPLVQALTSPDSRTQFAAVQAIVRLTGSDPYAGSSRVMETLSYLLSGSGQRMVLVAHPRRDEATRIATLYGAAGWKTAVARNGSELLRLAQQHADVELALLSDALDQPRVLESLALLRSDYRGESLPVGVMVTDPDTERGAQATARNDALAVVIYPPHQAEGVRFNNQLVLAKSSPYASSAAVRAERALAVVKLIRELLARQKELSFYEFNRLTPDLQRASFVPHLAADCFAALAQLADPAAQTFLLEQATLPSRPLAERKQAMEQFAASVEQHGRRVTQAQRLALWRVYREAIDDPEQRQLLGRLATVLQLPLDDPLPHDDTVPGES
jgi:CheY-like chemotaxis protein